MAEIGNFYLITNQGCFTYKLIVVVTFTFWLLFELIDVGNHSLVDFIIHLVQLIETRQGKVVYMLLVVDLYNRN